jgi:hypothetical protein
MIRGVAYVAGIPAVGHMSGVGTFHAGSLDSCPNCKTNARGANLMNDTTTPADLSTPVEEAERCTFETPSRDLDGALIEVPCGAPVTHRPILDDAYAAHLRAAGDVRDEAQPRALPVCDGHYAQLLIDVEKQPADDPARFWIHADARTIHIGYTKVVRPEAGAGFGYVPMADGYRPGAEQHVVTITVDLSPSLQPYRIAELVFIATNAPEELLAEGSAEELIRLAIEDTGYKGVEAHWSLSVGDTVQVGDGPRWACEASGWTEVK